MNVKKMCLSWLLIALCLTILANCSSQRPNSSGSLESGGDVSRIQEISLSELHQYFQQVFDTKGNALDTPEQLALELAEVKSLASTGVLPSDYESQYKAWRTEQIKIMLDKLYAEYNGIIADLSQNSGPIPGACYAENIDFAYDGVPELFILSLERIPDYDGVDAGLRFAMEVYGLVDGNIEKIGEVHVDSWAGDSVGLCKYEEASFVHIWHYAGNGDDGSDEYYSIKDGVFSAVDYVTRFDPGGAWMGESNYTYKSFDKSISEEEYQGIQSKYLETDLIAALEYTTPNVNSRGILPAPSPDVLRRAAMLNALNNSDVQYARLADMDGDGAEDLITVVYGEYFPIFRIYLWSGTEIQTVNFDQEIGEIGGIYKEKETGKIYVCYEGGAGPYSWYFYERVSEVIKISEEELSWEECQARRSRYELVEDLMYELPKYGAVDSVKQQLVDE